MTPWATLLLPCLLAEVVGFLLSPVLPLFANKAGFLPSWLWWFQTPDNPIDGDEGHWMRWENKSGYLRRVAWLARNRAYGFKLGPLGCDHEGYVSYGNTTIRNRGNARDGEFFLQGFEGHWYKKVIKQVGRTCCIQLAFGWQLDSPINGRCLYMFSPRITKFYKGAKGG